MRYKQSYDFYVSDDSFDWPGPFGDETERVVGYHGFSIECDIDDNFYIETMSAYGDFSEMEKNCKTLQGLRDYVVAHLNEVKENSYFCENSTPLECFEELIEFLSEQIEREKKVA